MNKVYKVQAEGSQMFSIFLTRDEAEANAARLAARTGKKFNVTEMYADTFQ